MKVRCENCRWFDKDVEEVIKELLQIPSIVGGVGFCRCGLPRIIAKKKRLGVWPVVSNLDYCSEWKNKIK